MSSSIKNAAHVAKTSFKTVVLDPQIIVYPVLASIFTSATYAYLGSSIFNKWYNDIFSAAGAIVPNKARVITGLVVFSAFYAAFVGSFFTCAVSAAVLAKLEGRPTRPLDGLVQVARHLFRVARFAVLSVFMLPVGIYAQRRKLPRGIVGVLGSSLTLHMASVAPAILTTKKPFGATVRDAIDTLGTAWKEGLWLKVGMYGTFTLVVVLPKLIQHHLRPSAANVGWLITLELAASGVVVFKVINAIFTSVLYYQVKEKARS